MTIRLQVVVVLALAVAPAGCGPTAGDDIVSTAQPSRPPATSKPAKPAPKPYPDPAAWGRKTIKLYHAQGRWDFMSASIAWPHTKDAQLNVETDAYDKDENRGDGPIAGLCVMFTEYAQRNYLSRVVIHAADSAPLMSQESTETETWSHVYPAWTCHSAG